MGSFGEVFSSIWGVLTGSTPALFAIFALLGVLLGWGIYQLYCFIAGI